MLEFNEGGLFHLPIRCSAVAPHGDLCDSCQAKEKKTQEKVREITGSTLKGVLPSYFPSYLMGRVTEPIPFWSRLYGGAWYAGKIESGCTVSEETMAKAKKAAATAYEGVETVAPQPIPGKGKTKIVGAPRRSKLDAPVALVPNPTQELPVETVREIKVRKREIDGRSLYLGPKDKVYDLKFKYLGRLKEEKIVVFPDSDEGM
jgi:hypothetical protein